MIRPINIAQRYVGIREESRNYSPKIEEFWRDTDYTDGAKNREPWCAAFVCFCLAQAKREGWLPLAKSLPREAAVRYFLDWCLGRNGIKIESIKPRKYSGEIIVFLPALSHIGFIEKSDDQYLYTIEGNTNSMGSREGDGCYRKKRLRGFGGSVITFLT